MGDSMDLNDFDIPARVLPAQYSKTEALVGVGQKQLKKISVPDDTQLTLHFVTIDYLHSVKFKKLTVKSRESIVNAIELFLRFLSNKNYLTDSQVPNKVYEEFILFIKKNTGKKGNSVGSAVKHAKNALEWYLNTDKITKDKNYSRLLREYLAHFPSFQRSPTNAHPSLSELFLDCPYSDTEIIKSLRLVCCWLLLEYDRQRKILLSNSEVNAISKMLKQRDICTRPVAYGSWTTKYTEELNDECRRYYAAILTAVLDSNDLVLMERLIQSTKHPFGSVVSLEDMQFLFSEIRGKSSEMLRRGIHYKGKQYNQTSIMTLTYRDLLAPSIVEVFAAQCFLASDRVQTSNLDRLKLSDVTSNMRGIQAQHGKGRRDKKKQKSTTSVYPPQQLIHDTLESYFDSVEACQPLLAKEEQGIALPYLTRKNSKHGFLGLNKEPISQCFKLLITEGSHTQKSLFKDITQVDAEPFLWIVRKIFENNNQVGEQDLAYATIRKENRKNGQPMASRSSIVSAKKIGINPTFIGQSRVAMDGGVEIHKKGISKPSNFSDSKVEAQLTNHTPGTKHNTYHDRSNAKEVIESRRNFAVQMGELMIKDAAKMGGLMKGTQVVNFEEAKNLLGSANASEDFKNLINEIDEDVGLTGEIILDDNIIFVANDLTAALIFLKMSHIEQQIPRLLMDSPDSQNKAQNAIGEKVYLQAVFDRFPEDIQVAGKTMSKNLTFSFSDLI